MNEQQIREIVEAAFKSHFGDVKLLRVNVRHGFDYDDDPVVDVNVIYDGKVEQLNGAGIVGVRSEVVTKVWREMEVPPASPMSTSSPGPTSGVATRRRSDAMAAAAGRGAVLPPLGRAARECCGAAGSGRALRARVHA